MNEIAKDPAAFKKYQGNAKVMRFYQRMAGFVGERLEQMGAQRKRE